MELIWIAFFYMFSYWELSNQQGQLDWRISDDLKKGEEIFAMKYIINYLFYLTLCFILPLLPTGVVTRSISGNLFFINK